MDKKDMWKLFELTGNIEYYIKYKKMMDEKSGYIGDFEDKGNNN